jgi:hypothetical protein
LAIELGDSSLDRVDVFGDLLAGGQAGFEPPVPAKLYVGVCHRVGPVSGFLGPLVLNLDLDYLGVGNELNLEVLFEFLAGGKPQLLGSQL